MTTARRGVQLVDHKTTAGKIRDELNEHLKRLVSTKNINPDFTEQFLYKKPLHTQTNASKSKAWSGAKYLKIVPLRRKNSRKM